MPYHHQFFTLPQVPNTNNYAMAKVHAGLASHGDAWFTPWQTQGRGQRGRIWEGGNQQSIAISIVLKPTAIGLTQQFLLSAAVAAATHQFFAQYAGNETAIKWTNDIYWRDRKAAGILIENIIGADDTLKSNCWKYAVAGIGLNINQEQFDPNLPNAVSLRQITGKQWQLEQLARELHIIVMQWIDELLNGNESQAINYYNQYLYKKNNTVLLKKNNIVFASTIGQVTVDGRLHTTDIVDNSFAFGEIDWPIPQPV
jgi:BirA family transcriptional regulator, biotin operon repressor / biotin---[acetyl-CoA-carboxylase] ligase